MLHKRLAFVVIAAVALSSSAVMTSAAEIGVCQLAANRVSFDHQNVSLQGVVISLKETTSRAGNDYTTFKLQDGGCDVNTFMWGHPTLTNGDRVHVDGVFETEHHQGRYTFYNEVQATKITPSR
jgi:hypothetical protein